MKHPSADEPDSSSTPRAIVESVFRSVEGVRSREETAEEEIFMALLVIDETHDFGAWRERRGGIFFTFIPSDRKHIYLL